MNPILRDFSDHFETERLLIRSPRPGDGAELNTAVNESLDHLRAWMPWAQIAPTLEESEATARRMYVEFIKRENLVLFLFLKNTNTLVGGSGLHRFDWAVPRFEIGYWVRKRFEGQGYITEGVEGITRFAFKTLGAERVEIRMDDRNTRSWRVAERLHFKLEGVLRSDERNEQGRLRDTRVYSYVRAEWENMAKRIGMDEGSHFS